MSIFDWFLDDPFFDWFWGEEPEEVKKARENLKKASEEFYEARRKAVEEQLEKCTKGESGSALALPNTAIAIPFGGSEQEFQAAVERLAKAHPDAKVEGKNVEFPNGFYRSVRIEKKG